MGRLVDLRGKVFGHLVVIQRGPRASSGKVTWECLCDCGSTVLVRAGNLRADKSRSCGCKRLEKITTHGHSSGGASLTYASWRSMMDRCYNENFNSFPKYGGRGIVVCKRWHIFKNFLADMGERVSKDYSLDRFPTDVTEYKKSTCRWASRTTQSRNRTRNVRKVSSAYKGVFRKKGRGKWEARIKDNGRSTCLGYFDNEADAAQAYNKMALSLWGPEAFLNEVKDDEKLL